MGRIANQARAIFDWAQEMTDLHAGGLCRGCDCVDSRFVISTFRSLAIYTGFVPIKSGLGIFRRGLLERRISKGLSRRERDCFEDAILGEIQLDRTTEDAPDAGYVSFVWIYASSLIRRGCGLGRGETLPDTAATAIEAIGSAVAASIPLLVAATAELGPRISRFLTPGQARRRDEIVARMRANETPQSESDGP